MLCGEGINSQPAYAYGFGFIAITIWKVSVNKLIFYNLTVFATQRQILDTRNIHGLAWEAGYYIRIIDYNFSRKNVKNIVVGCWRLMSCLTLQEKNKMFWNICI